MPTIPLGTDEKLFTTLHRRAMDVRPPPPWAQLDLSTLTPSARDAVRAEWELRALAEYRSMAVVGALIARFPEAGLPIEVITAASRVLQDEARHTEICAQLAERLGGTGVPLDVRDVTLAHDGLPAHLFVARWTLSLFCVGECSSVALLRVLQANSTDPCVRVVIETLLRDEILHDQFGWALARTLMPRLRPDEREWLSNDLANALAHYESVNAGPTPIAPDDTIASVHNGSEFGVVPRGLLARAFYQQIDSVILPALESLGLDAREAWSRRTRRP